jgi:cell division protein FtsW
MALQINRGKQIGRNGPGFDWALATVLTCLILFGSVMVFSASYPWALENRESPFYYALLQIRWLGVGLAALVGAALVPYRIWERWSIPLMALGLISLMAVLFYGENRFGATRTFGGRIQPSEPVKVIVLIYISTWLASKGSRIKEINYGLIPFGVLMGIVTGLIVAQPDISTTILIVATALIIFFLAGAELKQLFLGGFVAVVTFWLVITRNSYASRRVSALLESIQSPLNSPEWQIREASTAIVRGGPLGVGLGNSTEKLPGRLPLSWSDNIFAVIGEEMGLLGTLLVILLFTLFVYRGLRIASESPDVFGSLLAVGITALIILQAIIHIAVAVAVAPPTGVTLPFVSFGGSSLVTSMGAAGILLNISRYRGQPPPAAPRRGAAGARPHPTAGDRPGGGLFNVLRSRKSGASSAPPGQTAHAPSNFGWWNRGTRISGSRRRRTATNQRSDRRARSG